MSEYFDYPAGQTPEELYARWRKLRQADVLGLRCCQAIEALGARRSPYHVVKFYPTEPLSPSCNQAVLGQTINNLMAKIEKQAKEQREKDDSNPGQ